MADATDNNPGDTPDPSKPVTIVSESLRRKRALNGGAAPAAIVPPQDTPEAKAAAANLVAALEYAAAGMAVFPVSAAKKPLTEQGYLDASTNPKVIEAWHKQWAYCEWAWSVPDDVLVADVDRKHGRDGYADFQRLFGLHPRDVETPMATSPSGGMHVFYRASKAYKNIAAIDGSGIDARSRGGYVLLPAPNNGRAWIRPIVGAPLLDAPEWFDRIERAPPGTAPPASALSTDAKVLDRGRFALEQACHAIENAPNGAQEFTLNKQAYTVGGMVARGDMAWAEAREALIAAAKRMPAYGKPWRKLDAKVERALEDGMARPLPPRDSDGDLGFTVIDDPADEDDEDDEALLAQRMPTIDPKAFYGVLGPLVTATTMRSEATRVGIALQTVSHVSLTMRPFYKPRDDGKVPFNTYTVQLGLSAVGRKGTSAEVPDNHLGPAIMRLARTVEAQLAFVDEDGMIRLDTENAESAAARKLQWVKSVCDFTVAETEAEIDKLEREDAEATAEIKKLKGTLARTKSPRTMKECKAGITEAEARTADLVDRIAEAETYLTEMQAVLENQPGRIASAQKTHAAAMKALAALPPSGKPPTPWLSLFASLAGGPITARGISTGEGLVELIRDPGIKAGNHGPVVDPGVEIKVAFLNLEELGGVLAVSTRPGATLSTMLRTAFDCKPLELINKTSPLRCVQPYVVLAAGCTPAEFMGKLFAKGDTAYSADNGLANRFCCVWVMRDRIEPDPRPTPGLTEMMDAIARNILRVYEVLKPQGPFLSTPIDFWREAKALYSQWYVENETRAATSANAAKLIKRKVVHLWKIAGVLAMMNGEFEISAGALEAAIAWVDYATATIDVIASTAAERKKMKVLTDDGKRVLEAAKDLGADEAAVSARDLRRKTPFDKKRFDAAVTSLLRMGPSPITVREEEWVSGTGVRQTRAVISLRPIAEPPQARTDDDEAY